MLLHLVSDLHLDFRLHSGRWRDVLRSIEGVQSSDPAEVLIIAGDLAEAKDGVWSEALVQLAELYPTVLLVLGNHDFYGSERSRLERQIDKLPTNVIHLDASEVQLGDLRFAGCTLWFPRSNRSGIESGLSDFAVIPNFRDWVYQQHQRDINFLKHCRGVDVIITHHAPSPLSLNPKYAGDALNHFFINNLEELIETIQPQLWLHGHTHDGFDYTLGSTRVLCHPLGYPFERYRDEAQYKPLCLEVNKACAVA